jgi:signal transduction histidine kinase/ActR/RegA family two-component response regulator
MLLKLIHSYLTEKGERLLMAELNTAAQKAQAASEAKTMFISNVSHDLRTPIHALLGLITLIEESDLDSVQQSYVTTMKSSCYHLTSVINNVLDFAKIEHDKMEFTECEVDLYAVVQHVADSVASLAEEKSLELLIDLDVPHSCRFAVTDEKGLCRVLTNLLGNAIKFTHKGHVRFRMYCGDNRKFIGAKKLGLLGHELERKTVIKQYVFEVEDSGRGMTQEFINTKLFQPFTQEDGSNNHTRIREGTGLGMSLSQRIISKLGSKIDARSVVDQGSTFSFSLNLKVSNRLAGSLANLSVLKELIPFQVISQVYDFGFRDPLILRMIQEETKTWNGIIGRPRCLGSISDLAVGGSIIFLVDSKLSETDDKPPEMLKKLCSVAQKADAFVCYILISRARKESFLRQSEVIKALQKTEKIKVVSVLLPVTPLKLHRAVSTCVTHIRGLISLSKEKESPDLPRAISTGLDLKEIKVLLAEDNIMIATVLSKLLKKNNIDHVLAQNGQEALNLWKGSMDEFHILLMDIQMPIMDGFTTVEKIRETERLLRVQSPVKIIFMSANASVDEIARAKGIGGNEYLTKPVEFNILLRAIKDMIGGF